MDHFAGKIRVTSGKLLVTDPCYIPDSLDHGPLEHRQRHTHVIEGVPEGDHTVYVEIASEQDTAGWGRRVANATLICGRGGYTSHRSKELVGHAAVDSGQMSFMDAALINDFLPDRRQFQPSDYQEGKWERDCHKELGDGRLSYLAACGATMRNGYDTFGANVENGGAIIGTVRQAFACSSGYGDGLYPVYVERDNDGKVVSVFVDFLGEDEEEDDD